MLGGDKLTPCCEDDLQDIGHSCSHLSRQLCNAACRWHAVFQVQLAQGRIKCATADAKALLQAKAEGRPLQLQKLAYLALLLFTLGCTCFPVVIR